MKHIIESVDILFAKMLEVLQNHNENFLIEGEEGFTNPEGEEIYDGDYQVYSDVDRYGHYNVYAITKLENGIAHLIGIQDTEGTKEIEISLLSMGELYDLAKLCTNI